MTSMRAVTLIALCFLGAQLSFPVQAKEYKVDCTSVDDCLTKGDTLTKKRKLSLALEAYRNAIKFDSSNQDAWRKFEQMVVRIAEEGGC